MQCGWNGLFDAFKFYDPCNDEVNLGIEGVFVIQVGLSEVANFFQVLAGFLA